MNRRFCQTLIVGAGAALLAACGGQSGNPPQSSVASATVHRDSGSYGDLLYIWTEYTITMVSWPEFQIVGTFQNLGFEGLCSDPNNGNVFAMSGNEVLVYAHGGTTPIATLYPPSGYTDLQGCSVDPTTGDLALKSYQSPKGHNALLIFPGGQGGAIVVDGGGQYFFLGFAYDDTGNLFSSVIYGHNKEALVELPKGQSTLMRIRLPYEFELGQIQWDGQYLVWGVRDARQGATLYQLTIANNKATIAGTVRLAKAGQSLFCIHDGTVFQSYWKLLHNKNVAIAAWPYPEGGKPSQVLYGVSKGKNAKIGLITYSVAPSH
jgi:hypothetical protein